jgi:hypothetical protein
MDKQEIIDFSWLGEKMIKIIGVDNTVVYESLHNLVVEVR